MSATAHNFTDSFMYEACDVPPGLSLRQWRRYEDEARREEKLRARRGLGERLGHGSPRPAVRRLRLA